MTTIKIKLISHSAIPKLKKNDLFKPVLKKCLLKDYLKTLLEIP